MIVGAARPELEATPQEPIGQGPAILDDLVGVSPELRLHSLEEADSLGGDLLQVRPALEHWEDGPIDRSGVLVLAEDQPPAGAAKSLVGGGGHHVGVGN